MIPILGIAIFAESESIFGLFLFFGDMSIYFLYFSSHLSGISTWLQQVLSPGSPCEDSQHEDTQGHQQQAQLGLASQIPRLRFSESTGTKRPPKILRNYLQPFFAACNFG